MNKIFIQKSINDFTGVAYRLQRLDSQLMIYNDAKSTNHNAVLTALRSFDEPVVLIMGGKLRGQNDQLGEALVEVKSCTQTVLLLGDSEELLAEELGDHPHVKCKNLDGVINWVKENSPSAPLVFSPGYPSFDQFKDYQDRGSSFTKLIKQAGI